MAGTTTSRAPSAGCFLRTLAAAIGTSCGWRRRAIAVLAGAAAALALPPLFLLPLFYCGITVLVWLLDGRDDPDREAGGGFDGFCRRFADGWWFGVGYFLVGLYWVAHALMVEPERFAWAIPFALGGLSGGLALFVALAAAFAGICRRGLARVLALASFWILFEWLRGVVLTGFPWNPAGSIWQISLSISQLAAVTGIWGLSFLALLAAAAPALLPAKGRGKIFGVACLALGLPALVWAAGGFRLAMAPPPAVEAGKGPGEEVILRIVQAHIPQPHKWEPDKRADHFRRYLALTARPSAGPVPTHIIWPETAAPYVLARTPAALAAIAPLIPEGGALITGSIRLSPEGVMPFAAWNSIEVVDHRGRITGAYDKAHLVPFGEYVPFREVLSLAKLTYGDTDFSTGKGAQLLAAPGLAPFRPLICYEAIFPAEVVGPARPAWLLNVTNDAWFGLSSGPYQHFASARLRSIEQGLPLARAANTGISALIDGYGRVLGRLDLGASGVLDAPLPPPLDPTLYSRFGDAVAALLALFGLLAAITLTRPRRRA